MDIHEWGRQFTDADRRVALTETDKYMVSTVFLGSDHSFGFGGPPIVFETMIFAERLAERGISGTLLHMG